MTATVSYPVRVEARLDAQLSRWLWLVKWLLLVPHMVVLAFLWVAFVVLTLVALISILVTGRYPRALFDFNVGVLRWSWRVHYYGYAALATDRYPPFTLADVPDYPARLQVDYPERLSRGLVLVKWLLAIPHLVIVAVFAGGGAWVVWRFDGDTFQWGFGGLIGILVLIAAVVLLFSGSYPRSIYAFALGMDRWVMRVACYVGLMTDQYPPFRLDLGGSEPAAAAPAPAEEHPAEPPARPAGWTAGRVVAVVLGSVLMLAGTGPLLGGGTLLWADLALRDSDGYLGTSFWAHTPGYAVSSGTVQVDVVGVGWPDVLGDVRLRVEHAQAPAFIGIARSADADRYLDGVAQTTVDQVGDQPGEWVYHAGRAPEVAPTQAGIWVASASGSAPRSVSWPAGPGDWTVVVMNADGTSPVDADLEIEGTVPALRAVAIGLLVLGLLLLAAGGALTATAVHRAGKPPQTRAVSPERQPVG